MRRARRRGRPPGQLGTASATLSLRIQPGLRGLLEKAASKVGRSLNREIIWRLRSTLGRDRPADQPQHIRALSEMVERMALSIERVTERQFNEDRYTAEQVAKAVDLFLWQYSPKTKAVAPPAAVAAMKALGDPDPSRLGTTKAGAEISLLESASPPPIQGLQEWPPEKRTITINESQISVSFPEARWGHWQIREHLKPSKPIKPSKPRRHK